MAIDTKPKLHVATRKERKNIMDLVFALAKLFDLLNYDNCIVYNKENYKDMAAKIDIDSVYRRLTITIYPSFFDSNSDVQASFLMHEFCHTITHPLHTIADDYLNGKFVPGHVLESTNEHTTSLIEQLLSIFISGGGKNAKSAYRKFVKNLKH